MENLIEARNQFFEHFGQQRWTRIVVCVFVIASIWNISDLLSGKFTFNFSHEIIALVLGIVAERLIPWGKTEEYSRKRVKEATELANKVYQQNQKLTATVKKQQETIEKLAQSHWSSLDENND